MNFKANAFEAYEAIIEFHEFIKLLFYGKPVTVSKRWNLISLKKSVKSEVEL